MAVDFPLAARLIGELDSMARLDPAGMGRLVAARVECAEAFGEHPTVQVGRIDDDPEKPFEIGILGVLNGLVGVDPVSGWGPVAAVIEADGRCTGFRWSSPPQGRTWDDVRHEQGD